MLEASIAGTLTGRGDELRLLELALAAARAGQPRVVLVEGPGGIGKTALIRRFTAEHGDVQLLWASGDSSERAIPFGLADQLLRRAGSDDGAAPVLAAHAARYAAIGLSILETLGELQREGPVVLVLDDVQWADPSSMSALLFAVRRLIADTVLVILAARPDGLHLLPDGFARLADSPEGMHLKLGPLGFDDVRAMARGRALPLSEHALRQVHELSAGVPLHLCALLDEWTLTGDLERITAPPSYAALIAGRLAQCGDEARRLVEAASVLGRRASIDEVARVADVQAALEALDEAVASNLVRVAQRSIEFVHPLIRSAVHDGLGPAQLADLHAAAAELAEDPDVALMHRAQAAASPDAGLAEALERAAGRATAAGNWLRAADFLDEAAQLSTTRTQRERRTLDAVNALCEAGDLVTARSMLPRLRDFEMSAEREFVLGRVALTGLDVQTAQRHFEAAWAARPAGDHRLGTWIASELAGCAYFSVDARRHVDWAWRAMGLTSLADVANAPAVSKLALALALSGQLDEGLGLLDQAIASATARAQDITAYTLSRGRLRFVNDDLPGARADLISSAADTMRQGSSRAAALALGRLSLVEYLSGHWELALTHSDQALAACVDRTDFAQLTAVRTPAVLVLAAQGAWPAAEHHLHAMRLESGDAELPAVYGAYAGAHLAAAKGDPAGVVSALAPILALRRRDGVDEPGFWAWQDVYADALVDLDRLDEAETFLVPHEALALERGRRSMSARLTRARARLEAARGRDAVAEDAFLSSERGLSELAMPYELALSELAHGQFLRRRRQRRAAAEVLANARDRLLAIGAHPALDRCDRELEATGLSANRPASKGAEQLTPQELTVARLVVAGMTNREVAGELMLSTKTIEVHLTHVYAKLEVSSRSELRARARKGELESLRPA